MTNHSAILLVSALPLSIAAFLAGALLAWLFCERRTSDIRVALAGVQAKNTALDEQKRTLEALYAEEKQRAASAEHDCIEAQTRLAAERSAFEAERVGLTDRMRNTFTELAGKALGTASQSFMDLAKARLGEERAAVAGVVSPVETELKKFQEAVLALQTKSAEDFGTLRSSLEQVTALQSQLTEAVKTTNDATGKLRTALTNPQSAGRWGEITLDRIVELGGMTEHCHFERQEQLESSEGTAERPDMTIRLTGGLQIPVDAKASGKRYFEACEATDEQERARLLKASAQDLRERIKDLRRREYDKTPGYAGMTILFVPNEAMLSSALAQSPDLVDDAAQNHIVVCSPLLLLCYLKAFANGWRMQKQQENAQEVMRRGTMLHDRLLRFFSALNEVGKALNGTVKKYNDAAGKIDRLLVPGRELKKLLGLSDDIAAIASVDESAKELGFEPLPIVTTREVPDTPYELTEGDSDLHY
jgi:DNA recombination protein RmuC